MEVAISIRFAVLGSGSSGNCTFLATDQVKVLIDAGFSARETAKRLAAIGESLESIQAIFITHEHTDHVNGLARLAAKHKIPVYLNARTRAALPPAVAPAAPGSALSAVEQLEAGEKLELRNLTVEPFTIPHDAVDPVAYRFTSGGVRVALATDLGYLPENVKQYLRGCHALIVESNHDLEMLRTGPYPWHVKQRVLGRTGHLSNAALSEYLREEFDGEAQTIVLAHLSTHNNYPELAQLEAVRALEERGRSASPKLVISSQASPSELFEF